VSVTTDPTASTPRWAVSAGTAITGLQAVSCPSTQLCVAVAGGAALISTDPGATRPHWTTATLDSAPFVSVSCASAALCVAANLAGVAEISTNPTAAHPHWTTPAQAGGGGTLSVSCPSVLQCVLVGARDVRVLTYPAMTTPLFSAPATIAGPSEGLTGVSCPSITSCIAIDNEGNALSGSATGPLHPPAASTSQITAAITKDIVPSGRQARIPALRTHHEYRVSATAPTAGRLTIAWFATERPPRRHSPRPGILLATGTATLSATTASPITIRLTGRGDRLLRHSRQIKLTARGTFARPGHASLVVTQTFTLR
jgi:hypothetical protein